MTSLHSGSLCLSGVCSKVPPASGIELHVSQRQTPIGVRGCASLVGRLRGCDTAQVQKRHVVNDRQLMVRRSTPLHKSVALVEQVAVPDAETCQSAAAGLPLIACQSTWDLEKKNGRVWGRQFADFARLRRQAFGQAELPMLAK